MEISGKLHVPAALAVGKIYNRETLVKINVE
jgi:hypothetical protein